MGHTTTNGQGRARVAATGEYYEIRLKGHLDEGWAERFGDIALSHAENGETVLAGLFQDQAALFGVLLQIHGLGLQLISVHRRTASP